MRRLLTMVILYLSIVSTAIGALDPWKPYRIASGLGPQECPSVSGTFVVWHEFDKKRGVYDVIVADANLLKDRLLVVLDDDMDQMNPVIWDTRIVWQEWTIRKKSADWDLMLIDLADESQDSLVIYPIAQGEGIDEVHPAIHGNIVVWEDIVEQHSDIYGADITILDSSRLFGISLFGGNQSLPTIWRDRVIWQDDFHGDWDLFLSDIWMQDWVETWPIVNRNHDQMLVKAADGVAVWQDNTYGDWDIVGVDISDYDETRFLADYPLKHDQMNPAVSGHVIAYQDNRNGHWDIYVRNIHTNVEIRVTSHKKDQINPAISGDLVVWQDNRHGDWSIYALWMDGLITSMAFSGAEAMK